MQWITLNDIEGLKRERLLQEIDPIQLSSKHKLLITTSEWGDPTYKAECNICGSATQEISNPNQTVLWFGALFFCRQIQEEALSRYFDSESCNQAQKLGCNCTTSLTTPSPTSSFLSLLAPTPPSMDNPQTSTSNNTANNTSTTSSAPQHMASVIIVMYIVFSLIRSIIY